VSHSAQPTHSRDTYSRFHGTHLPTLERDVIMQQPLMSISSIRLNTHMERLLGKSFPSPWRGCRNPLEWCPDSTPQSS